MNKTCETCAFLIPDHIFMRPDMDEPGRPCRRMPPDSRGRFSVVAPWQREIGCGEWRKKEDEENE